MHEASRSCATSSRLLRIRDVLAIIGVSRASLYRLLQSGQFPRPVKISERAIAWREQEIAEWVETRPRLGGAPRARDNRGVQ